MYSTKIPFEVEGHVKIEDDLGNVLVDKKNAVHPQNIARAIARALSNEKNALIHRIAFGNGGTAIDAAFTITFKTPNDGQPPDIQTWESRLYNETYSEIVDDSNAAIGTDPGSAGPRVGTRAGGGANPANDPATVEHVSGPGVRSRELGITSEVVIVAVLNPSEPSGQVVNDQTSSNINSDFTFDEIGLYTTGNPARASAGVQDVDVSDKTSGDISGLVQGTTYDFDIAVDGGGTTIISFTPSWPTSTYGDLCEALNTVSTSTGLAWGVSDPLPGNSTCSITDTTGGTYPSIEDAQTFGFLRFTSGSSGSVSTISLADGTTGGGTVPLFTTLAGTILTPADGLDKGVQNDAINPSTEQERLLTHLIFSPVLKSANRTLTITYTLTIAVARTQATA